MNRIVLTGDTHGLLETAKILSYQKTENKLDKGDYLIICGDCGAVWDKETLKGCIDYYSSLGTNILFVDGNHENFDLLNSFPVKMWNSGKVHILSDNFIHLMRGQIFTIQGKRFLTVGGANSTDKEYRQNHISWWHEEDFSSDDLKETYTSLEKHNYKVDFVISHSPNNEFLDILYNIFTKDDKKLPFYLQDKFDYTHTSNNLQKIADKIEFKKWFCGHLHLNEDTNKYCILYNKFYELT